jgi:hypothetical protein
MERLFKNKTKSVPSGAKEMPWLKKILLPEKELSSQLFQNPMPAFSNHYIRIIFYEHISFFISDKI